jgi:hypothetical protein
VNILQAIADPQVFGHAFKDKRTWAAWQTFLAALFGLPMTPGQLVTYQRCTGRTESPTGPLYEAWLVVGRRGGKSFMLAVTAVFLAAFKDWKPFLSPGERATIVIIAADRRQARTIMRYVRGLMNAVPVLSQLIEADRTDGVDLTNRVTVEVHTASFRTVRGYTIVAALLDEVAFWQGEDSASPDTEILTALRPSMATIPGAILLAASSPYARRGALWDAYQKNFGKETSTLVWQAPTRTMNPSVPRKLVDDALEADPSAAGAEYLAEFRTDIESFISQEALDGVTNHRALEHTPISGRKYFAFVDPSGGSNDSMTLAISHKDADGIGILDLIRERRPPFSPEAVVTDFAEILGTYRVTKVQGDRYGGEWCRETFRRHHIGYDLADQPKSDLYRDLLPLINSRRVELLSNKRLINQLLNLERRTARSGRDSIDHAPGAHDDLANAVAGALIMSTAKRPRGRMGTIDVGGFVHWKPDEDERPRIQVIRLTEKEAVEQGLPRWK